MTTSTATVSKKYGSPRSNRPVWKPLLVGLFLTALMGGVIAFPYLWRGWVENRYSTSIYDLDLALQEGPSGRVAIVYGARVYPSGRLSGMLRDRVDTAVALYQAGKVDKLLVSGDNSTPDYDEPTAMMAHAIARGVPAEDVQPDFGGRRTYDTCYRAKHIFQLDSAVLITQEFHLPRALFTCEALGLEAVGVIADRRPYDPRSVAWSESREVPALVMALIDVIRQAPAPVLGEPIPLD